MRQGTQNFYLNQPRTIKNFSSYNKNKSKQHSCDVIDYSIYSCFSTSEHLQMQLHKQHKLFLVIAFMLFVFMLCVFIFIFFYFKKQTLSLTQPYKTNYKMRFVSSYKLLKNFISHVWDYIFKSGPIVGFPIGSSTLLEHTLIPSDFNFNSTL